MTDIPANLDEAIAAFDDLNQQLVKLATLCESELKAGRTGLDHYHAVKALRQKLDAFGMALAKRIDEELDRL